MKKMSFVIAIVTAALLAGACGKKKDAAAPVAPPAAGSDMPAPAEGSDMPAPAEGSAAGSAAPQ
jgi:hypothetical protein